MTFKEEAIKQQYLQAMGIEQWVLRDVPLTEELANADAEPSMSGENANAAELDWAQLQNSVMNCSACALSEVRSRTIFGSGHPQARLMIIGSGPGPEEDKQGLPFVGSASQLLTEMLSAIGFKPEQVFITNSIKCMTPNKREPSLTEVAECEPLLLRQIDLINPEVILLFGNTAAQNLLQSGENLAKLRGTEHRIPGRDVPVYVSYHPSYLLRRPSDKGKTWQDLKLVLSVLNQPI